MNIVIRKGREDDFPAILSLVKELAFFQGVPERVRNTVEEMSEEKNYFNTFVAFVDQEMVAIATYFFAYYTWVGRSLYIDDLYVKQSFRSQKIGTSLLKKIFEVAREENCKRIRLQVSHWNTPAIEFYGKCGAEIDRDCYNCDFEGETIKTDTV